MAKFKELKCDKTKQNLSCDKTQFLTKFGLNNLTPQQRMRCTWGSLLRSRNVFFFFSFSFFLCLTIFLSVLALVLLSTHIKRSASYNNECHQDGSSSVLSSGLRTRTALSGQYMWYDFCQSESQYQFIVTQSTVVCVN